MIWYRCFSRYAVVFLLILGFTAVQANVRGDDVEVLNLNPSFEEIPDFKDWTQYVNAAAAAFFDIDKEAIEGKQCAHIEVTEVSGTNWHVGLTQDALTVEAGELYTVDFFAKADVKRIINLELKRSPGQGDWEGIASQDITINEEWDEYFINFTPSKDYEGTAFLGFWVAQFKGEVWIDGVRLYEGKKQEREEIVPKPSVESNGKLVNTWAAIKWFNR